MIKFANISKRFQANFWEKEFNALDDVSFEIHEGDLIGFLGANGAGKTTLIKCLMNFSKQDSGEITFSSPLKNDPVAVRAQIGYLPERPYIYPYLTGREFLLYIGSLYNISEKQLEESIQYWSERLQIAFALDRKIKTYSKGMQQRVGFIASVINNPKFLVLDEPLSGLDPMGRRDFKQIFRELYASGTTIFFSSHVVADVEEICNKVVFLEKGKLVYEGSIEHLLKQQANLNYEVIYSLNDETHVLEVEDSKKDEVLTRIMKDGGILKRLEKKTPSLEEIIYKIKK